MGYVPHHGILPPRPMFPENVTIRAGLFGFVPAPVNSGTLKVAMEHRCAYCRRIVDRTQCDGCGAPR